MKKQKVIWTLVILLITVIIVILVALLSLGHAVKIGGEKIITKMTHCETHIGDASINAFTGHLILKDVLIKNPKEDTEGKPTNFTNEDFFKLGTLEIDLNMRSLLSDEIHVKKVVIKEPEITYENTPFSDSNLDVILAHVDKFLPPKDENQKEEEPKKEEDNEGKKFIIDDLLITGAQVNLSSIGITVPLDIPEVSLQNLGKPGEGITVAQAIQITFKTLFLNISEGLKKLPGAVINMGKSAGEAILDGGKAAGEAILDGGKAVRDFFKK